MTKQEAAKLVGVALASCPTQAAKLDRGASALMVDAWAALLDDIAYEQANAALRVLLQTRPFLPSVAEIRAAIGELERGPKRSGVDAWGEVLASIRRHGSYRQPGTDFQFQDPLVARCVASMGWQSLCSSENLVADRARFAELYDALATQDQRERQAPALAAASEKREQLASVTSLLPRLTGGTK